MRFNDDSRLDGVLHDREITSGLLAVNLESNAQAPEVDQPAMIDAQEVFPVHAEMIHLSSRA
jgi:hypothetical protein